MGRLIIKILAVWRLTALFVYDRGPFRIFEKTRETAGVQYLGRDGWPRTFFGQLLSCVWCFSIWAAVVVWIIDKTPIKWILELLAFSGGAVLFDEVRRWHEPT